MCCPWNSVSLARIAGSPAILIKQNIKCWHLHKIWLTPVWGIAWNLRQRKRHSVKQTKREKEFNSCRKSWPLEMQKKIAGANRMWILMASNLVYSSFKIHETKRRSMPRGRIFFECLEWKICTTEQWSYRLDGSKLPTWIICFFSLRHY